MSVNQSVHFSDWVIGHSHLAMLGSASSAAAGGWIHAWQRFLGALHAMLSWSYWLLLAGLTVMVLDLTTAGLVEAHIWQSSAPWLESVRAAKPFWLVRTLTFADPRRISRAARRLRSWGRAAADLRPFRKASVSSRCVKSRRVW